MNIEKLRRVKCWSTNIKVAIDNDMQTIDGMSDSLQAGDCPFCDCRWSYGCIEVIRTEQLDEFYEKAKDTFDFREAFEFDLNRPQIDAGLTKIAYNLIDDDFTACDVAYKAIVKCPLNIPEYVEGEANFMTHRQEYIRFFEIVKAVYKKFEVKKSCVT